ncbi:hypothetical protein [Cypionkella sp.]|uniref:hypothetical protein n=1 Tax=Cypionkella sp. TaxID=2811411 RepID=UPI002721EBF8|nr:hypothetical protein [Cypionkella sp.]MDO8983793.1 hypothetical protein [Cypionkella sp.]MDP2051649.1 hypothetical protein [Cypionkella sp.]
MKRLERMMCEVMRCHMETGARPVVPLAGVALWQIFAAISPGRFWGEAGPQPLTVPEIREQGAMMGLPLELRHVDLIRALDRTWRELVTKGKGKAPLPELTPELFDAMF